MADGTYDFAYEPTSPYAHALSLVSRWRAPGGQVVVDLGCGYGAIAEEVAALGLQYLGVDADPVAVDALAERGVQALVGDLGDPGALRAQVTGALGGRPVAALCALDAIEHLANATEVLAALAGLARELGGVPLVVSIPNVSHRDVAVKLLLGRWDVTPTGLLDETHLHSFSPGELDRAMVAAGWHELDSYDFVVDRSDQHFPPDCVALEEQTPLGSALQRVRRQAAPGATVNQFVRAYRPRETPAPAGEPPDDTARPFLSVVVRSAGDRPATLDDLLLSLAGQDHDDFEVVVVLTSPDPGRLAKVERSVAELDAAFAERVRIVPTERALPLGMAGNLGVAGARGRYVAVLDDDQVAFGHWVGALAAVAAAAPGRVVHAGVASQETVATPGAWRRAGVDGDHDAGAPASDQGPVDAFDVVDRPRSTETFAVGLLELLAGPPVPLCGYALPRSLFTDLGERFDEDLPALEDWDLLLRAVERCGVVTTGEIGLLRRVWVGRAAPHGGGGEAPGPDVVARAIARAEAMIAAKLDATPLLLDRGSASRLTALLAEAARAPAPGEEATPEEVATLRAEVQAASARATDAERRLAEVHASTSWRVTAPLRSAVDRWRAGRR